MTVPNKDKRLYGVGSVLVRNGTKYHKSNLCFGPTIKDFKNIIYQ
jgi:hypothetical protein